MKKIIFASALLSSLLLSAQFSFDTTRYGVTGGATYSRITNAHNPSGPLYSFYGGFLALIPLNDSEQFFLQPEVEYLGAGESGRDSDAKGYPGYDAIYANHYISLPIYFKAYFSEAESEFFGIAGPKFNILLGQTIKDAPLKYTVDGDPATGVNGKAASFNFALGFGLGYSYKRKLEVTARYDLGLSNTYKGLMSELAKDPNTQKSKSEQVLSVGLSYIFD